MGTYRRAGEELSYREIGQGVPVIVVPGGPGRDADYLQQLGGLAEHARRQLVVMEPRGTGATPEPRDPARYAATSIAADLEALRQHVGIDTMDLIAHSAGCSVAFIYAAVHPHRVGRLVLITPATRVIGLQDTDEEWQQQLAKRSHGPWFADAQAALEEIDRGGFTPERRRRMSPLLYGSWSARAQQHAASDATQRNMEASRRFWDDELDPTATRRAVASTTAPVRVLVGELDLSPGHALAQRLADNFADAQVVVQPAAGHFPWVDDPKAFAHLATDALDN